MRSTKRKSIENEHCVAFMARIKQYHPEIADLIFHIPNESRVTQDTRIGISAGMPDYCLPIPKGEFGALYIEMKKPDLKNTKSGGLSPEQVKRIASLSLYYKVDVCYSWEEALKSVLDYMEKIY